MWSSPGSLGATTPRSPGSTRGDQVDTDWVHCDAIAPEEFVTVTHLEGSTSKRQPSADQLSGAMTTSVTPAALSLIARFRKCLGEHLITLIQR